jgi:hypothetical protein
VYVNKKGESDRAVENNCNEHDCQSGLFESIVSAEHLEHGNLMKMLRAMDGCLFCLGSAEKRMLYSYI